MAKKKENTTSLEWNYSSSPESTSHINLKKKYDLYIDGKFVKPSSGNYFKTYNPATEEVLAEIAYGNEQDIDKAVKAARKAYTEVWSKMHGKERAKYIYRIARLMQERAREFAVIESLDAGKTIRESRDVDVPLACNHFFYYAGWADKLEYAFPNRKIESLGVAGQIIPWNFPILMAAWKIAPALAAGNTIVLKPAETTPLTALKLAELFHDAGLPAGVVNIVTGHGDTGAALVNHNDVDKIAFTGSTGVGKLIQKAIAGSTKKCTLELGGKSANIILEDAPIDQAVEGIINGIFFNQGHVCCAGSRLFVQESVAETVIRKLKQRMESLIVGDPMDKNTDIGAINSKEQLTTIDKYIQIGINEGAEMYQPNCSIPSKGYFCKPTLFLNASQSHRVVQEEIFGPVVTLQKFSTEDEALQLANACDYGLAAIIWTQNISTANNLSLKLQAGIIWVNTWMLRDLRTPFGGMKNSGIGREGGWEAMRFFTEAKNICIEL